MMKNIIAFALMVLIMCSCVSNKKYTETTSSLQSQLEASRERAEDCETQLTSETSKYQKILSLREEQINDLKAQLADAQKLRDKQLTQVGDLTVLTKSANENVKETLSQLEKKDRYIQLLNAAKSKADSINLALAVNLKSVLKDGIEDEDITIKVDKTVVFINLSDKMLYNNGSAAITPRAEEVLGKIAQIISQRPDVEVMVEGYTDSTPIKNNCIEDNWDLSVKRATAVVRVLQNQYKVDPDKLIAAGRGQYNAIADNDTAEGRAMNRRTRIIILPKLNQFYDLLNPNQVPK